MNATDVPFRVDLLPENRLKSKRRLHRAAVLHHDWERFF